MRKALIALTLIVFIAPAHAADDVSEAFKRDALLRAYKANGNSMTRWGSIDLQDLTDNTPLAAPGKVEPWAPSSGNVDVVPPAKKGGKK